jgi:predicted nucleic acid-binding protein
MGTRYLIDTNTVIDFFNGKLPDQGRQLLSHAEPVISIITRIELFSSNNITNEEILQLQRFVDFAVIHAVNLPVAIETIEIRKKYKVKLPDAIIAATAIVYDFTLITRNVSDFNKIENLKVVNPYEV